MEKLAGHLGGVMLILTVMSSKSLNATLGARGGIVTIGDGYLAEPGLGD